MEWSRLVELVGRVRATSKKGEKVALIAELLRQTRGPETGLLALYLTGTLPQGRIGVGWKTLEPAMPSGPAVGEPLTLERVDEALSAVAAETGPGSAERRLRSLRALLESTDERGAAPARRAAARRGAPGGARRPRDRGDRAGLGPRPGGRASRGDVRAGPRGRWPARRSRRERPASAASRCACSRRWRRCWRARPATPRRRWSDSARRPSSTSWTARGCRSTGRATRCASSPGSCRT